MTRERGLTRGTNDAVTGDRRVGAIAHDVPDGAGSERTTGEFAHEPVGCDSARRDLTHDREDAPRPPIRHSRHTARL
jgi:hypothetical protein